MSSTSGNGGCERTDAIFLYALGTLPATEVPDVETHLATCPECRQELATLRPVVDAFAAWPAAVLQPPPSLWQRLTERIAAETGGEPVPRDPWPLPEPEWEEVAPGISCKLLATDAEHQRVSMLVRLEPGVEYPPHRHAGVEELHLLDGELVINDKKLRPGDYNRAEVGSADTLVRSETGCTCVLITSTRDELR